MDFDPRWIVYGAMAFPTVYLFIGQTSPFILLAVAILGIFWFHSEFIHKSEKESFEPVDLGYPESDGRYKGGQGNEPPTLRYSYNRYPPRGNY